MIIKYTYFSKCYNEFKINKYTSEKEKNSISKLLKIKEDHLGRNIGIGHTRWATHGIKSDNNAHPHADYTNEFIVVHNGIIENYNEIKKYLESFGIISRTETDTEIMVNLISHKFKNDFDQTKSISENV